MLAHVYVYVIRLYIYTLTWYKILWLLPDLVKIWFLTVAILKTIMGLFFCIIWDLFGTCYPMDWPNGMLEYTQVHHDHCKSAIEQTWMSVKVQFTPTVEVASVAFCTKKARNLVCEWIFILSQICWGCVLGSTQGTRKIMLIYIFVITIKVNVLHFILQAVYFQIRKTIPLQWK